jgi:hypothetical protein
MRAFPSIAASLTGGSNGTEHYESGAQARGSGDSPHGRGVEPKTAYASTVGFYRSSGQEWTRQLG